ncbi:MAG TPA: hypothetical protein VMS75_02375 [Terriglobales bacterium]|nr:hypothetical protein [Terriglobales bacterium]
MGKKPLLGGFVFAGLLATGLIYLFIKLTMLAGYSEKPNRGEYDLVLLVGWIIIPLSLTAGSFLTGYLSQPYVQKRAFNYLLLSPGLYISICLVSFIILLTVFRGPVGDAEYISLLILVPCLLGILFSIFGIYLGFKVRAKKQYKPPSLDLGSNTTRS